jgi:hypothetical protein
MSKETKKRVKLKGGFEHTASSVEIKDDGSLVVEFYDFSDQAERSFGNDVAYILTVNASDKEKVLALMNKQAIATDSQNKDELLLQLLEENFNSYFDIQEWFQVNGITYRKDFDPWA